MRYAVPTGKKLAVPSGSRLVIPATPIIDYAVSYAFSLRTLVVGYSGPLIRLRRDSDEAESDFFAVDGILDTAAIVTWLGAANGFLVKWYDQSGNANDIVQATAISQPKYIPSVNGRPAFLWDGIDDFIDESLLSLTQPLEMSVVWQSSASGLQHFFDGDGATERCVGYLETTGYQQAYAGTILAGTVDRRSANTQMCGFLFDGVSSSMRFNGAEIKTGDVGTWGLSGLTLGARYSDTFILNGHIHEFILKDGLLSTPERDALEANQINFFGVS